MPLRQLFESPGLSTPASLSCLRGYYSNMALGTVKGSIGLYRLAHENSYGSIGPAMNAGKSTVVEAVQDVLNALFDARNHCIKFLRTAAETASCI